MKRTLACTVFTLLFGLQASLALAKPGDAPKWDYLQPDREQVIASLNVVELLKRHHYNKPPLNDARSAKIFDSYIEMLDPGAQLFPRIGPRRIQPLAHRVRRLPQARQPGTGLPHLQTSPGAPGKSPHLCAGPAAAGRRQDRLHGRRDAAGGSRKGRLGEGPRRTRRPLAQAREG